nr:putative ribonuclease H-like domain-containing protein [Tanacetum cinerariifolium]
MIRVYIGGKSKSLLSHLTTDPLDQTSKDYEQWEQEDLIVFSWLIQNIEPALTGNLTEYPTAKMLWDTLVVTYISEKDKLQTFNLHVKANDIKQNNSSLKGFWISLQGGIAAGLIANETEGLRLVSKVNRRSDRSQIGSSSQVDKSKLKCGECGMTRHTKEGCFRLVGYPNWWTNGHKKGTKNSRLEKGKASIAGSTKEKADTTDQKNLTRFGGWQRHQFTVKKMMDIRTGAIIGRGTEIKGLYYVDEVTQNGAVMLSHRTGERKAWLCSQGESESLDTLNWLRYVACGDGRSHSTADESHLSTQPEDHINVTQTAPNLIPEEQEMVFNQEYTPSELNEHVQEQEKSSTQEETSKRYVLPPRANQGVPPKRYSLENMSRGSRYPMANIAKRNLSKEAKAFVAFVYYDEIPAYTEQALKSKKWKKAMEEEMEALTKNNTWEKCVLPPGKKTVGCRWVFTIKYKPDGTIKRYKARLVAKGYTQTYIIDYSETFSPVAKINTIRVLCSAAANKGWPLHPFDVKNAFLHGELKKEVYMEALHGFTNKFGEREVCLLKKSLYGLKQSPRAWFDRLTFAMKNHGFKQSNLDYTLFLKQRGNLITCLIIYIDDMIITGDDKEEITKLKKYLFTEFEMKDLGRLKYFLGIEVLRSKQGIFMCQKRYILDLLAETGMIDCKPADTPMIVNNKLYMEEKAELADKGRYQQMKNHMKTVIRILRYLKGTMGHRFLFKPNRHLVTQLYTDADWAGDKGNRRSTSGYFTVVGGNLVTWRSKKQKVVSLSSAKAKFRGIARGLTEVLWVRRLLTKIGYPPQKASKIMNDNKAAI